MNCVELQESLAEIDDGSSVPQRAHLKTCAACSDLLADLNLIVASAAELRSVDEPSPRVWNSIESTLRQEGLIHAPRAPRSLIPSFAARWGWSRWLVPTAAAILIAVGAYMNHRPAGQQVASNVASVRGADSVGTGLSVAGLNDDDLLQEVSDQSAGTRAQYADNLRLANEYIQDARTNLDANPNDEEARRSLMEAYQQKSMLFEMAMDRSLP